MSTRTLDGVRTHRLNIPAPRRAKHVTPRAAVVLRPRRPVEYPDLSTLLAPVEIAVPQVAEVAQQAIVQTQSTAAVQVQVQGQITVREKHVRPKLRIVRRSAFRSGLSWFMICAVLSTSAIGIFSVFENGRAAKRQIQAQADSAESALGAAALALASKDPSTALAEFDKASASFEQIQAEIDQLSTSVRAAVAPLPGDPLSSADNLAEAGVHVATAGEALTRVVSEFNGVEFSSVLGEQVDVERQPLETADSNRTLTDVLTAVQPDIEIVGRELTEAGRLVMAVDTRGLPGSVAEPVTQLQSQLPGVLDQLQSLGGLVSVLAEVAGATTARTYAVVFQNPNELRPTGGFWGQLAFVKLQHGKVEKLDIKSIYDPAGQVTSQQRPPEGLDVISESFELQDANWYADFPTSARVLLSFLSETGDPRLDGVIALNPRVVTELLALTGPIDIDELDLSVSEDTFVDEAQYEVPDKDPERDKTFFPEFTQQFLGKVFALDRDRWLEVAQSFMHAVSRKDIQIFFGDPTLSSLPQSLGADGVLPSEGDVVAPVIANIGGGKTDQYVSESRALSVTVGDRFIRHKLEITRTDTRTDQFKDRDNRSYVRVYVPAGAELREASGFDTDIKALIAHDCSGCDAAIGTPLEQDSSWEPNSNTRSYTEANHTVFANWVTLEPGEERTLTLVYDVPREQLIKDGQLQLHIWRQPGSAESAIDLEVTSEAEPITFVTGAQKIANGATGSDLFAQKLVLDRDHVIGIVLQ